MWKVLTFKSTTDLDLYLRTQQTDDTAAAANPVALAKVASIYFDAASGHHVLVIAP